MGKKKVEPRRVEVAFDVGVAALEPDARFVELCEGYGIAFDEGDVERLGKYLALLIEANKAFNLTSITEPAAAWERHVFDSLTLMPFIEEGTEGRRDEGTEGGEPISVIDVGSGGGLPGIPLAIAMPHVSFTLLEATGKKCRFLEIVCAELGLGNVEVVQGRAEVMGQDRDRYRETFDVGVARAVGKLAVVAELVTPFVRQGGRALLIKGERAEEELAEADAALKLLHAVHVGTVPTPTGRVVVLEKGARTPRAYPRKSGEPKKSPLG
jgi:16S rRNA (guanine527-N7)-methyltransferase